MYRIFGFVFLLMLFVHCERKGDVLPNGNPDTRIVLDAINLTGDDRLNSVVRLSWMGIDADGFVTGYEVSLDEVNWNYTQSTDSLFRFSLDAGSDTTDIDLYIRAIDNDANKDESPAYLRIPLKNTPPVALFDTTSLPEDTTHLIATFSWSASDRDGNATITQAFIKVNEGDWYEIDKNSSSISLAPTDAEANGTVDAFVHYGTSTTPLDSTINGLRLNDTNRIYLKVVDLALAESKVDTTKAIFITNKESDLLVVTGQSPTTSNIYKTALNSVYPQHDYLDYFAESGINQPKSWQPTFDLILGYYDKLFFFGDGTTFRNSANGQQNMLITFAAPSIQTFSTAGGKSLIVNTFNSNNDVSDIVGILPFDSLSSSSGQALFQTDSAIVPVYKPNDFPTMSPISILLGMDPMYHTADATILYAGQLEPIGVWEGPSTMAAGRLNANNNLYQAFFTAPIYQFGTDSERQALLNQILNNEFNW